MNIWEILGIEPTRDQGAVRRAYAAAAARYNPEEHPEEFLAVRQAYEQALAFARSAEEPVEVPELPELTMSEQPLPAMEPESRTAATGGFTLELEPEGSRQPDFPALERFPGTVCVQTAPGPQTVGSLVHLAGVPGGLS